MVGSAEGVLQRQSGEVEVMMFGGDGKRRERKAPCFSKQGVEEIKSLSLSFCMVVLVGAPSFFFSLQLYLGCLEEARCVSPVKKVP